MTNKFDSHPTAAAALRQHILAIYSDALIAWSHGEPIDTAAVHREIDALIDEAFGEQAKTREARRREQIAHLLRRW
jgi:hypothetical protein